MNEVKHEQGGFTLLELLVVIVIIGLLAAFVAPKYFGQIGKSKAQIARAQIEAFDKAIDQFQIDTGHFPTAQQGLIALTVKPNDEPNWNGPYLKKRFPSDPWGKAYKYVVPGTGGRDFDLISYGSDGAENGDGEAADVNNFN